MILRTNNLAVRALCAISHALPYAVSRRIPIYIFRVRVGNDTTNFVSVIFSLPA
jgi:hypothetical protein